MVFSVNDCVGIFFKKCKFKILVEGDVKDDYGGVYGFFIIIVVGFFVFKVFLFFLVKKFFYKVLLLVCFLGFVLWIFFIWK